MAKVERQVLHHCLSQAKHFIKLEERDKARDYTHMGIAYTASRKSNGLKGDDSVEGVKIDLWLERFWMFLENNNLML
tara:strand:- start:1203 stop:1433 length:231 start_codon:yes stop_codon:yes gene_type:complete